MTSPPKKSKMADSMPNLNSTDYKVSRTILSESDILSLIIQLRLEVNNLKKQRNKDENRLNDLEKRQEYLEWDLHAEKSNLKDENTVLKQLVLWDVR